VRAWWTHTLARRGLELLAALVLGGWIGSLLVSRGPDIPIGLSGGALLALPIWFSLRRIPEGDAGFVQWVFALSAAGRIGLALALHSVISDPGTLAGDDWAYEIIGRMMADYWNGGMMRLPYWVEWRVEGGILRAAYYYWNAIWFYSLGDVPLLLKTINAVLGSLVPVYLYRIAWRLYGEQTARLTMVLAAVIPSLVLWSSMNLRDGPATLAITASIYYALRLKEQFRPRFLVGLGLSMLFVAGLRTYMFVILGGALALSFIGLRKGREGRDLLVGLLVTLLLAYLFQSVEGAATANGSGGTLEKASFQQLHEMRKGLASGNSAYAVGADVSSPGKALLYLPVGIIYLLFAPFPWQLSSLRQILTLPEMLLFYAMVPSLIGGVRACFREGVMRSLPVLLPALLVTLCYALVEGNVGTAYRHKSQILGLFLLLAARGWVDRRGQAPAGGAA
jgi:4-amino-4-deoxy-L-arabinose transferase-like glycosyltransferase